MLTLAMLALLGLIVYGGAIALLFGRRWFFAFQSRGSDLNAPPVDHE